MRLDEIIFNAIRSDQELMTAIHNRVKSTCFEVSPNEVTDNTPIPYAIVTNDGFQNNSSTKDYVWEGPEDRVQAGFEVAAKSPNEVADLVDKIRQAVENYVVGLYNDGQDIPQLENGYPSSEGIAWDWTKPCYFQRVLYSCTTKK